VESGVMALGSIESTLSTIAACGGVGAFIDFWIGKRAQERIRDWVETWWLKFSYVNLRNFGREEAVFALAIIDHLFGQRFLSPRRFVTAAIIASVVIAIFYVQASSFAAKHGVLAGWGLSGDTPVDLVIFAIDVVGLSISITITRFIVHRTTLISMSRVNLLVFSVMLLIQYFAMVFWTPIPAYISMEVRNLAITEFREGWTDSYVTHNYSTDTYTTHPYATASPGFRNFYLNGVTFFPYHSYNPLYCNISVSYSDVDELIPLISVYPDPSCSGRALGMISAFSRLGLAVLFVCSYLLKPTQRIMLSLWARIVESEKPIFTLLFAGGAAAAKAIEATIQAF
jgi:hypothetical protein